MRRYYIVSGDLLVLPIIDFAVAAPTLVQEKRQAGVDAVHIPEDAITMLGKRGSELDELWLKYLKAFENHFADKPSAARPSSSLPPASGWTNIKQPLPSIPEEPSPMSSPDHAPPSPGSLSESGYESASSTLSDADHGLMGAHAPQPNLGPSNRVPLIGFDSDHRFVVKGQPSTSASPTEFDLDHEYQAVHPPPTAPGSPSPRYSGTSMRRGTS